MPQAVDLEKFVLDAGPDARGFKRDLGAGVKHAAIEIVSGGAVAGSLAVVREPATDTRGHIEPAEDRLRQQQLMVSVSASGGEISKDSAGFCSTTRICQSGCWRLAR